MRSKEQLLSTSNYLLTRYQNEIFRQLITHMESNNLTQGDIAKSLGVSNAYVSQILNGDFNFTLKKLIELGLLVGKVPHLSFVDKNEYWLKRKENIHSKTRTICADFLVEKIPITNNQKIKLKAAAENSVVSGSLSNTIVSTSNEIESCLQ